MSRLSIRCVKAAFVFLVLGIGLGAMFAFNRGLGAALRPLHVELNLWGWTTLLIYGMAYHMLPRFTGRPLRWTGLAGVQSWLAIAGVVLITVGWLGVLGNLPLTQVMLVGGGVLQTAAALLFTVIIGKLLVR